MSIKDALAVIPERQRAVNELDDQLSNTIRLVEQTFSALSIGLPAEVSYETEDGRFFLVYEKLHSRWCITYSTEDDDFKVVALTDAPRHVRAEVFVETPELASALERLILAMADSLVAFKEERSPLVEVAKRIARELQEATIPRSHEK